MKKLVAFIILPVFLATMGISSFVYSMSVEDVDMNEKEKFEINI